jgi:hypothetical protein
MFTRRYEVLNNNLGEWKAESAGHLVVREVAC